MPVRKKSGNLSYAPRTIYSFFHQYPQCMNETKNVNITIFNDIKYKGKRKRRKKEVKSYNTEDWWLSIQENLLFYLNQLESQIYFYAVG